MIDIPTPSSADVIEGMREVLRPAIRPERQTVVQELFEISDGLAICSNPGGRFHGWLFQKHPDGQYVSVRKLESITDPFGFDKRFLHITPKVDACDHNFTGWRDFPDGNGGEQVCDKCGMGAQAHSLRSEF